VENLTIIGAGAWGSVLAQLASSNHHQVNLWSRHSSESIEQSIEGKSIVISAISIEGVASIANQLSRSIDPDVILVTATKGLDPETGHTPSQIWQAAFPHNSIVVLSGPNLSQEIALGLPAATVVASKSESAAHLIQKVFATKSFRVYTNPDPLGVELGGTLKNVIAIAVGVCDGLQLGTNAKAALITRAMTEIIRVGRHFGAMPETFWGLSGLGDLLATCNSSLSRNYQVGYGLAQGKSLAQAIGAIIGTAEGVNTANVLIELADREQIAVPICRYVYRLLNDEITPLQAVEGLMERDLKPEV